MSTTSSPDKLLRPMPAWAVRTLLAAWLCSYTAAVYAAAVTTASLAQVVKSFDFESLATAVVLGLIGGGGRTVITLATTEIIVLAAIREGIRDLTVAALGGAFVWLCLMVISAVAPDNGFTTIGWVQVAVILVAGYSKGKWRSVIADFISDFLTRKRSQALGVEPPPSSVRAPLEGK